jgi:hypothetical protein
LLGSPLRRSFGTNLTTDFNHVSGQHYDFRSGD